MDTHTAVAQRVYEKYIEETGDKTVTVVASTAHPFKFTQDVLKAITGIYEDDAFTAAERLSEICSLPVPNQINELKHKKVRHGGIVAKDGLIGAAREFLNQH